MLKSKRTSMNYRYSSAKEQQVIEFIDYVLSKHYGETISLSRKQIKKYKNIFNLKDDVHAIITTQASTKVYKCEHNEKVLQETIIELGKNSILEYVADSVILYKDAIYKQVNNIYLDESSTLIYSDGITSGWSPEGERFSYNNVQLRSNVYIDNKLILLDNLIVRPRENDVSKLGFFEEYSNFGTLLIINKNITSKVIEELRKEEQEDDNIQIENTTEVQPGEVDLGVFENNAPAYYCYKAVGFEDVILDHTETYSILGEKWKCKELKIEKR